MLPSAVLVTIQWTCDACGASGAVDAELPCASLSELTIEMAATAVLDALRAAPHPHPVRPKTEPPPD